MSVDVYEVVFRMHWKVLIAMYVVGVQFEHFSA
jgi:hypothetical protein